MYDKKFMFEDFLSASGILFAMLISYEEGLG